MFIYMRSWTAANYMRLPVFVTLRPKSIKAQELQLHIKAEKQIKWKEVIKGRSAAFAWKSQMQYHRKQIEFPYGYINYGILLELIFII